MSHIPSENYLIQLYCNTSNLEKDVEVKYLTNGYFNLTDDLVDFPKYGSLKPHSWNGLRLDKRLKNLSMHKNRPSLWKTFEECWKTVRLGSNKPFSASFLIEHFTYWEETMWKTFFVVINLGKLSWTAESINDWSLERKDGLILRKERFFGF